MAIRCRLFPHKEAFGCRGGNRICVPGTLFQSSASGHVHSSSTACWTQGHETRDPPTSHLHSTFSFSSSTKCIPSPFHSYDIWLFLTIYELPFFYEIFDPLGIIKNMQTLLNSSISYHPFFLFFPFKRMNRPFSNSRGPSRECHCAFWTSLFRYILLFCSPHLPIFWLTLMMCALLFRVSLNSTHSPVLQELPSHLCRHFPFF